MTRNISERRAALDAWRAANGSVGRGYTVIQIGDDPNDLRLDNLRRINLRNLTKFQNLRQSTGDPREAFKIVNDQTAEAIMRDSIRERIRANTPSYSVTRWICIDNQWKIYEVNGNMMISHEELADQINRCQCTVSNAIVNPTPSGTIRISLPRNLTPEYMLTKETPWQDWEYAILKDHFDEYQEAAIEKFLPWRFALAEKRKNSNDVPAAKRIRGWTNADNHALNLLYPVMGTKCAALFSGKTRDEIRKRAFRLRNNAKSGLTNRWEKAEIDFLRKNYPTMGKRVAEHLPGRTPNACARKACELGVTCIGPVEEKCTAIPSGARTWTPERDAILMKYYPTEGGSVYRRFVGISKNHCSQRAHKLNLKKESKQSKHTTR